MKESKLKTYQNSVELAINDGWNFEKIVRIKGTKIRFFILKREETEYLKKLKIISPEEAEEIKIKELYCSFKCANIEYYEEVIKILGELGKTVIEKEVDSLGYEDRRLGNLINI